MFLQEREASNMALEETTERVAFLLPLESIESPIELLSSCAYCGTPVAEGKNPWTKMFSYKEGNDLKQIEVKVDYCDEHTDAPFYLKTGRWILIVALTLGLLILSIWSMTTTFEEIANFWFFAGAVVIFVPVIRMIHELFVRIEVKLLPAKLQDYPRVSGHWGLGVVQLEKDGVPNLRMILTNIETAKKFKSAYPSAKLAPLTKQEKELLF
jgi:hypothetical protein